MHIEYLCDYKQYVGIVVKWIYNEFIDGIRLGISYEKVEDSFRNRKKESMPITVIALDKEICIGAASLVVNDLKSRKYTPWLAALYVDAEYRSRGIGKALIEEIQSIASRFGYDVLYLRTEHSSEYYKSLGWEFVEKLTDEFGLETSILLKSL